MVLSNQCAILLVESTDCHVCSTFPHAQGTSSSSRWPLIWILHHGLRRCLDSDDLRVTILEMLVVFVPDSSCAAGPIAGNMCCAYCIENIQNIAPLAVIVQYSFDLVI